MAWNNPALLALKALQTAADGKHTMVFGSTGSILPMSTPGPTGPPTPPPSAEGESQAA